MKDYKINPPRVLALGFAGLILLGSIILNLPYTTSTGESIGYLDALFTATSAVCVTGLFVVETAYYWNFFGQLVILILIQLGALGFMTSATVGALLLGKRVSLRERLVIKEQLNQESISGLIRLVRYVVFSTLFIESIGALVLSLRFIPQYGFLKGIWFSVFHSVSAFSNAGFDIIGDSISSFVADPLVNLSLAFLIILGGLGFTVLADLANKKEIKRLSLHSKLVLSLTGILIIGGTLLILIFEFNNPKSLGGLSLPTKLLAAFFQGVSPRTAGFSSLDLSGFLDSTAFVIIVLMFIGASPGSTGGGVKTTSIGLLVLSSVFVVRGQKDLVIFNKRIDQDLINRALAIVTLSFIVIITLTLILSITEEAGFVDIVFEATSAFSTSGLSRGITGELSPLGKILISLAMYLGRLGPLTMAYVFARRRKVSSIRYSQGRILVG